MHILALVVGNEREEAMKQLKRLRRIQTAVDTGAQGDSILIRISVPSVSLPARRSPAAGADHNVARVYG